VPSDRKSVTIQYRRLDDEQRFFGNYSLQGALNEAMRTDVEGRKVGGHTENRTNHEDDEYGAVALNLFHNPDEFFFGELVRFEEGAKLPLLFKESEGGFYNLSSATAPSGHEALKGILYFLVVGNDMTLIPGDISPARLERYIRWLLTRKTNLLSKSAGVVLASQIKLESVDRELPPVSSVTVHPDALRRSTFDQGELTGGGGTQHGVGRMRVLDVLCAAGMDEADVQKLVQGETELDVTIQIKFKEGRFKKSVNGDKIGRLFRNADLDDVVFHGKGGDFSHRKLVRLAYPANILKSGPHLDTDDVGRALLEAYSYFRKNGYIGS
jgi:hypothetical protein